MGNGLKPEFLTKHLGLQLFFTPNFSAMVSQRQLNDPFTLGLTLIKELATTVGCLFFCAVINHSLTALVYRLIFLLLVFASQPLLLQQCVCRL